ncbi:hydroxyglutarate oxidase [Legionella sainthelensi]|uniref:Hydroxyglutarate oxidase n=1 Tax=Legionella sainthelensi TaxID=28087 RepID=A0A0W0YEA7_9GAMM|nr:FAD-dependent oxidoreductase [Legionella sainthelensi]KTD55179.1 hydroxyglutarate oxidase [Legionella sainthelensi]VEH37214.1 glycerol-3-phosphate dehydrogenase, anaerobic, A subunit [Legionella sainthelensi]
MTALDAVIIGGGFYGSAIAVYLAKQRGFKHIVLVEREDSLLKRASHNNQARVHNGYHYPRSFTTAYRSRVNLPKFVRDWPNAVKQDFTKLYAIARQNSKVTAKQFERFCYEIGAKIQLAKPNYSSLFNPQLVERIFLVEEYAFDTSKLEKWAIEELNEAHVTLRFKSRVTTISKGSDKLLNVVVQKENRTEELLSAHYVFNCTYSGLNQFYGDYTGTQSRLKQEITEMALMKMPLELENLGITVMDGPFFSMMPFPAFGLHSLSHVRYTPHINWLDQQGIDPYERLNNYEQVSRVDRMIRDVSRYLPALANAKYIDSLFEVKTVLVKNESDDGRPILFEKHLNLPGMFSVLGGKIDNIYDVFEKLDMEQFEAIKPLEQVAME